MTPNYRGLITSPKSISIAITGRCNLHCQYCFYANEMAALNDLPTTTWLAFFDELGSLGVMDVCLTGGEAFTRPDLFTIIDGIITNRMRYNILSNGTLLTPQVLDKFSVGKRRLRLDHIQISIDGSSAEVHNLSRPNSFDGAIHGLRLLLERNFPVAVRVTINRHNVNDLENIAHLLLDELGLPSFGTNEAAPVGAGCTNQVDVALTADEMAIAMRTFERLIKRYPGRINAQAGPQAKLKMYAEMEHSRQTGEMAQDWKMGYLTACGCVFSKLDVLHDGTFVPCHMLPGISLGHVGADSLSDIWQKHPVLVALRERQAISMHQVPGCQVCQWVDFCNGSCPGLAHQLTGDFNRANPQDCYRQFLNGLTTKEDLPYAT